MFTTFNRPLKYQWDLIRCLVDRNIKILYKRSFLGILWMLIKPLLNLVVYAFVFRAIIPVHVPNFTSFLFTGLLFWQWFSSSLTQATGVIVSNSALIRQPGFPSRILPIVIVTTEWLHLMLAFPILLIFMLFESVSVRPVIFLLPLLMLLQFGLTLSLSYLLAAINVNFRDTQHTIGVLLQMLMYLSGIFYDITTLSPNIQAILALNPMVNLLNAYRAITIHGRLPDWQPLLVLALIVVLLLPFSLKLFVQQSDRFVEEV